MKKMFALILLFSTAHILACSNFIPESEALKAINLEPNAGSKSCADLPDEKCFCYDGIDFREAEFADNMILDFIRKEKAEFCLDEADCLAKEAAQACDLGKVIRTESEVYCAVEAYKKDGLKLVNNPERKAAREATEKALEEEKKAKDEAKRAAKERIKVLDLSKTLTTKQLTEALRDLRESLTE